MPDEQPLGRTEMIGLLAGLKQDLKQELRQELKQDLQQEIRGLKQELKQELRQELRQDLQQEIHGLKQEIFERIDAAELRGREHTERIETRLLTAFHNWSNPVNHRLRKLENSDAGVLERLASVEERLTNLELRP